MTGWCSELAQVDITLANSAMRYAARSVPMISGLLVVWRLTVQTVCRCLIEKMGFGLVVVPCWYILTQPIIGLAYFGPAQFTFSPLGQVRDVAIDGFYLPSLRDAHRPLHATK